MKTLTTTLTAATLTAATLLAAIPTGAAAEEPAATSSPRAPSRPRPRVHGGTGRPPLWTSIERARKWGRRATWALGAGPAGRRPGGDQPLIARRKNNGCLEVEIDPKLERITRERFPRCLLRLRHPRAAGAHRGRLHQRPGRGRGRKGRRAVRRPHLPAHRASGEAPAARVAGAYIEEDKMTTSTEEQHLRRLARPARRPRNVHPRVHGPRREQRARPHRPANPRRGGWRDRPDRAGRQGVDNGAARALGRRGAAGTKHHAAN